MTEHPPRRTAADDADDLEPLLRLWTVPASTSRLTDRIVAAATIDAAERAVCARKRDALEHALCDERVDPQVAALRAHVQSCAHCASEWANDHASDALLRAWEAPSPALRFVDLVLARLRAAGLVRRVPARMSVPAAVAACALIALGLWLARGTTHQRSPRGEPTPPALVAIDVDAALHRFGGDVHVLNVMNAQFPAGIGSFAPTAVALERKPQQPGAQFHRALRKVRRDATATPPAGASGDSR